MKKNFTGILSILLAFSLFFSLAACGKDEKETTTAAATTVADETTTVEETTLDSETTVAEETTLPEETTQPGVESTDTTGQTTSAPITAAEIVAYYNTAANKAKKDKPAYTLTTTNIIGDITSSSGLIEGLAKKVVPMFPTDPLPTVSVEKGNGSTLPVVGQNYGGKVEVSSLLDKNGATCVDKGSYYEITLKFKPEKLNGLPTDVTKIRHGQAFNMLTQQLVDNETDKFKIIVKIEKFAPNYHDSYVKCAIDKATGNMLSGTYYCVNNSDVVAKVGFSTIDANIFFGNKEEFTYKY
ncbi:MAG: hypothetical protein GXZ02_08190 [Clostridiales bacterium]|nr:hypothetical protein [Clostridiales bacterium]